VFMSVVMTMIWEFVFTRYLFGMDREQRQKLKSIEKTLMEVGTSHMNPQAATDTGANSYFQDQREPSHNGALSLSPFFQGLNTMPDNERRIQKL